MANTYYKPGQWNIHCDVCGFRFKSDQVRKRWDGLMVCASDFEYDHPQKFLRVTERASTVPFVRHQTDDTFIFICDRAGASGFVGIATVGCSRVGIVQPTYADLTSST